MTEEPSIYQGAMILIGVLWAGLVGIGTWVFKHTFGLIEKKIDRETHDELEGRVSAMEEACTRKTELYHAKLENKADVKEMDRQRNNIETLFTEVSNVRIDMNSGFSALQQEMSKTTVMLVQAINGNHQK